MKTWEDLIIEEQKRRTEEISALLLKVQEVKDLQKRIEGLEKILADHILTSHNDSL